MKQSKKDRLAYEAAVLEKCRAVARAEARLESQKVMSDFTVVALSLAAGVAAALSYKREPACDECHGGFYDGHAFECSKRAPLVPFSVLGGVCAKCGRSSGEKHTDWCTSAGKRAS